jgi:Zn-dependent protease
MRGAFTIARLFKIPIKIHWSFGLIFLYLGYLGYRESWNTPTIVISVSFVLVLFLCVILHEFGHALSARMYGVNTRDIILSPIGGVARLDHLPEKPWQEFVVAFAGPLVNIVIAALLSIHFFSFPADVRLRLFNSLMNPGSNFFLPALSQLDFFLVGLLFLNITLALFNLLPAFPMDGGRILRALLSLWLGRLRATHWAARIGQFLAIGIIIVGIFYRPSLTYVLVGLFVFVTAGNEYRAVYIESLLENYQVHALLRGHYTRVYNTDPLSVVLPIAQQGSEKNFLVFDQWQNLIGVLPEHRIQEAQRKKDTTALVSKYMLPELYPLLGHDSLRNAFYTLQSSNTGASPVYNQFNRLIGMVDAREMSSFLKSKTRKLWWKRA